MKKIGAILLILTKVFSLAACANTQQSATYTADHSSSEPEQGGDLSRPKIVIAYDAENGASAVAETANLLQKTLGGDLYEIESETSDDFSSYEFVLLGFESNQNSLPQRIRDYLQNNDFGARTIYPFVIGEENNSNEILSAISQLQPGALMGSSTLLLSEDASDQEIIDWAQSLPLSDNVFTTEVGENNTVASAKVNPQEQQVFYLWEEDNAPATTEYTENNGNYSDNPDFRPYITSYPVPEGVNVKGAVLICPGGAFQFRSDQPEGVNVAEALSALGYQSFVVDYRLRPYTQQEGALDLARAVRFVRAHADDYGIDQNDIAVTGFSAGGILCGEMLLNFDGNMLPTALDPDYQQDALDKVSADAAACGMIYSFYGRLSVGTTDVELLRSGKLPPTFYCYGTRDPFYDQFLANADAAEKAGVSVERLQLDGMPHGFGADGDWITAYDAWLSGIFADN